MHARRALTDPSETTAAVSWLRRPEAYPHAPREVTVVETHMSWVFLVGSDAYKLKKAIRQDGLDFSTPTRRRRNCLEEVRLNARLAPGVYRGVVPLTREADGRLAIGGCGTPVDWLVHMRRLPEARNLEVVIRARRAKVEERSIREAAAHLARFYAAARPARVTPQDHLGRLVHGVADDRRALTESRYGLDVARVETLARGQLVCLDRRAAAFDRRVRDGRIVEGHGDLRPEHVWIDGGPAIIDCVEFDRMLRVVDPADELAFLALECERLGEAGIGRWFLDAYTAASGDNPPAWLLGFYRVYRAMRRATIAARHLDDPSVPDPERFLARARRYLEMVEPPVLDAPDALS